MFTTKRSILSSVLDKNYNVISTESLTEKPEDLTVSQEGIGDLIKAVKRVFAKSAKEYAQKGDFWFGDDKDAKALEKAIKTMYLNDAWLKIQSFSNAEVSAKNFSPKLSLNGSLKDPKGNIAKAIADYEALAKKWHGMISPLHAKVIAVEKETKAASARIPDDDEDALIAVWNKGVDELKVLEKEAHKLVKDFPGYGLKLLGDMELAKDKNGSIVVKENEPTQIDTLPALDKDGVKWAANLILDIMHGKILAFASDDKGRAWLSWLDHSDGNEETRRIYDAHYSTYDNFFGFFYHQIVGHSLVDSVEYAPDRYGLIGALERWISLSIK